MENNISEFDKPKNGTFDLRSVERLYMPFEIR